MGAKNIVLFVIVFVLPAQPVELPELDVMPEESWIERPGRLRPSSSRYLELSDVTPDCVDIHPRARNVIKGFYSILPFFDRDHVNVRFLRHIRSTISSMADKEDLVDHEAAFYAAVLTPLIFLRNYRDTWCLLERFHRALRLFQISHPSEKRSSLKLLQNLRAVINKVQRFIHQLTAVPRRTAYQATTSTEDLEVDEAVTDKEMHYLKELIKNLG